MKMLKTSTDTAVRIGLDVGATKIMVGAIRDTEVLRRRRIELSEVPDPASCRKALADAIREVLEGSAAQLIGVGSPGPGDFERGVLLNEITMPRYYGWNLKADLEADIGAPVTVMNDVDAALLGEMALRPPSEESLVLLSVGTGVGAAWWNQGRLHTGRGIVHPEISQIPWPEAGPGVVLEDILSGAFVKAQAERAGYSDSAALAAAALAGDSEAKRLLQPFCRAAGWAVSLIAHLFCPQVIHFSGTTLVSLYPLAEPEIRRSLALSGIVRGESIRLVLSPGGSDATMIGATREVSPTEVPWANPGCRLVVCDDHAAMSRQAAEEVIRLVSRKPDALLIGPTGGTPTELYQLLAEHGRQHPGFFARVRLLGLDEWGGLGDDLSGSCQSYLNDHVVGPLGLIHSQRFDPAATDSQRECQRIARWLGDHGPADLCLLGVGTNGHLGLNEPAERMEPFAHRAELDPSSRRHPMLGGNAPAGLFGMTLGMRDILGSSQIICLWGGDGKEEVFERFRRGPVSARLPVSLLRTHPHAWILADGTKVPSV